MDVFLKQFPHLKPVILKGLRGTSGQTGKTLLRQLNEHMKTISLKQQDLVKQHDSLLAGLTKLEHLKKNMNEFRSQGQADKRGSVVEALRKHHQSEPVKERKHEKGIGEERE